MTSFTLVVAQINPLVGDVYGNVDKIITSAQQARDELGASLVVFPELALTGYPPEDLLHRSGFVAQVEKGLVQLQEQLKDVAVIVGHPFPQYGALYNAASLIDNGQITATYFKQILPNYGVFDEKRYFIEGEEACVVEFKGIKLGLSICEDIWFSQPANLSKQAGADIIININASPFSVDIAEKREQVVKQRVDETGLPIVYAHQVGGQDELVFDGRSFVMDSSGKVIASAPSFETALLPVHIIAKQGEPLLLTGECVEQADDLAVIYQALVTGLRDYVQKNGFQGVLLGLSGGIDSALTLALAVDAIGVDKVQAVMMPSRYTAEMSIIDAKQMADNLGVKYSDISIEPSFQAFLESLSSEFAGLPVDTTEENIQARCRGILLMALSNKTGAMLLSTGNKSEMAVGYSTLYGDMAGGFAPLKDVYKTLVYQLSEYRNQLSAVIPERIITRAPSAELAADQLDQDSLPDYGLLDQILQAYLEEQLDINALVKCGFDTQVVTKVVKMIERNEYKRRQAPPGIRISYRAFGRERRYPITSNYINDI